MNPWIHSWENAIQKVDPYEVLRLVLIAHHTDIIELNQEQLDKGLKSDVSQLKPYTSPYAKKRKKWGLKTSPTDFKVTGEFQDDMYANSLKYETIVGSRDFKTKYLENRDSNKIFALTKENIDKLLWEKGVADDFASLYTKTLLSL